MSTTHGGGPDQMPNITPKQERLLNNMMKKVREGMHTGATEFSSLFSDEENQAFGEAKKWFSGMAEQGGFGEQLDETAQASAMSMLAGTPAYNVDLAQSGELFDQAVATPALKAFSKYTVPEIQRAYRGFTSRLGRKVSEASNELQEDLGAQRAGFMMSEIAADRAAKEAAVNRIPMGFGLAIDAYNRPLNTAMQFAGVAGQRQGRVMQDEARMMPENNPWFGYGAMLPQVGASTYINKPSEMTGFGTFLNSVNEVGISMQNYGQGMQAMNKGVYGAISPLMGGGMMG